MSNNENLRIVKNLKMLESFKTGGFQNPVAQNRAILENVRNVVSGKLAAAS